MLVVYTLHSEEMQNMNEYLLYLPPEHDQVGEKKLICERWKHLMAMVDREYQTCRTYIVGIDIDKDKIEKLYSLQLFAQPNIWKSIPNS